MVNIFSRFGTSFKGLFSNNSYNEQATLENTGILKAYIPNFLYKPPYGYPRYTDVPTLRKLASSPYVFMAITTIIDEVCAIPYTIRPKERDEPQEDEKTEELGAKKESVNEDKDQLARIKEVKKFFENPNGNDESWESIQRTVLRDILELDSGIIVKVFNKAGKMVQIFSRDGGTFLKNPDIYGYFGNRAEIIYPPQIAMNNDQIKMYYDNVLKQEAAYFQYGWTAGAMPIPFGKKEIVWLQKNSRSDSIYGRSPVEILQETIQTLIFGLSANKDLYVNNNVPDGAISLLGASQDDIKAFRERWEKDFRVKDDFGNLRKKFNKVPISNTPINFTPFQLTNQQMQIIEQQQWFTKLVWSCFGITPSELGFTEDSNRATELSQSRVFKRKSVRPLLKLLEYHVNTQIMPEFGYGDLEFKYEELDVDEEILKNQLYEIQIRNKVKTSNEIREELGLEPLSPEELNPFGSVPFGNPFGNQSEPQRSEGSLDEDSKDKIDEIKEEAKALTTAEPVILRGNERLNLAIKKIMKQKEQEVIDLVNKIYEPSKIASIKSEKEYKDAWTDLLSHVNKLVTAEIFKEHSDKFVNDVYVKSLTESEKQFDMNFIPNEKKITFIKNYNFSLIKDMTNDTMKALRSQLERFYMNKATKKEVVDGIKSIFDTTEARAEAIFRTETDRIDNVAKLDAASQTGLKLMKSIQIVDDERTTDICKGLHAKYKDNPIPINKQFKDEKTGQSFDAPPFHVNCRSAVKFVQSKGGKE